MKNLAFVIIGLIMIAVALFMISRSILKKTGIAVTRAGRLQEMTQKVLNYAYKGKDKNGTIENLMKDFNLGKREAEYLYTRAMKQNKEEEE